MIWFPANDTIFKYFQPSLIIVFIRELIFVRSFSVERFVLAFFLYRFARNMQGWTWFSTTEKKLESSCFIF